MGVNEKNVAMSATETTYSNTRFLGADPLVKHGIDEDSMIMITVPFINSARQGVERLGELIEKYGTGQSNGISFADKNDIWYMETAGGHHWVAKRIPDDCYAVVPNQISIQDINFDDHKNYMYSPGLREFVKKNRLNPNPKTFNFRNIAGTHVLMDTKYNTSRAWYGQRLFSHDFKQKPTSQDIPFVRRPYRKLSIEDAEYFLASHY